MDSKDYWKLREESWLNQMLTDEDEILKRIKQKYLYMIQSIDGQISAFYQKYAGATGMTYAEAVKAVDKFDVAAFADKAKKYVQTRDFSAKANAELKLYNATMKINRLELLKSQIGYEMVDTFSDFEKLFGDSIFSRSIDELTRQAGILGESIGNNQKMARSIVNASFNGTRWSDRLWMRQSEMRSKISDLLTNGLVQGKGPRELARELQDYTNKNAIPNTERLMRTELARVQTDAQMRSFEEAGFEKYMFIALKSSPRTCTVCAGLDGMIFPVKDGRSGENMPPMHPNCRCSTAAYVKREDEDQPDITDWNDIQDPAAKEVQEFCKNRGVQFVQPEKLEKDRTSDEIIAELGGGDKTTGSCASLAFAYTGNRAGYDIHDFRGGNSQYAFSIYGNIKNIANIKGVDSVIERSCGSIKSAKALIAKMKQNKEYVFTTGRHAAIVKRTNNKVEYLEMQSASNNGFKDLTVDVLKYRFGCTRTSKYMTQSLMIDVESLAKSEDFVKLLGYINTSVGNQLKGVTGSVK